jgi:hypothetical protein
MSDASNLQEKARMFERRAEEATDPISKQHYKEMAAHWPLNIWNLSTTK